MKTEKENKRGRKPGWKVKEQREIERRKKSTARHSRNTVRNAGA
jgi:hypothetical protein